MTAKSQAQRGLIFGKRTQYGSKDNTPKKWKWIWDEDYENKGKLPKKKVNEAHNLDFFIEAIYRMLEQSYGFDEDRIDYILNDPKNIQTIISGMKHGIKPNAVIKELEGTEGEVYEEENSGLKFEIVNDHNMIHKIISKNINEDVKLTYWKCDNDGREGRIITENKTSYHFLNLDKLPGKYLGEFDELEEEFVKADWGKINEGGTPFSETRSGEEFLQEVYDLLMTEKNLSFNEADFVLDEVGHGILADYWEAYRSGSMDIYDIVDIVYKEAFKKKENDPSLTDIDEQLDELYNEMLNEDLTSIIAGGVIGAGVIQLLLLFGAIMYRKSGNSDWLALNFIKKFPLMVSRWWRRNKKNGKLREIVTRLEEDPEVMKYVNSPNKRGWREMLDTKLTDEEKDFIFSITRNLFKNAKVSQNY